MKRELALKILQEETQETDGFEFQSRLRDDILDAMIRFETETNKLTTPAVVGRSEQLVCDVCDKDGWIRENKGDIIAHRLCNCNKAK